MFYVLFDIIRYVQKDANFSKVIEAEARELAEVPGGAELLILIGFVYLQEAKQHMDTFLGYDRVVGEEREEKRRE